MKKSELPNWLGKEYLQWEALLDEIGLARMDQPGVNGDWSMKHAVAHLTGWNRWLVARIQPAQRGAPEPSPPWPSHLDSEDEIKPGSTSPISGARSAKSWMRLKYSGSFWLSLKAYPTTSASTISNQSSTLGVR
jgi:hypothetical protein